MSQACADLATKQDLDDLKKEFGLVKNSLSKKLDSSEKDSIIKIASGLGATSALALLDPKIADVLAKANAAIGKVGELGLKVGNAIASLSTIFSILGTVVTIVQMAQIEIQISNLKKSNDSLAKENAELAAQVIDIKSIANANAAKANANAKIAQANANEVAKANQEISIANAEITALGSQLGSANSQIDKSNSKIASLASLANSNAAIADANAKVAQANADEISQINAYIGLLESEIAGNKGIAKTAQKEAQEAKAELASFIAFQAKLDAINKQVEITKTEVAEAKKEAEEANSDIKTVKSTVATHSSKITDLNGNLAGIPSTIDKKIDTYSATITKKFESAKQETNDNIQSFVSTYISTNANADNETGTGTGTALGGNLVNQKDVTEIKTSLASTNTKLADLDSKVGAIPNLVQTAVLVGLAPQLTQLNTQTSTANIATAAAQGVCSTTNPGGCMQNKVVNPLSNKISDISQGLGNIGTAAILDATTKISTTVNTINTKMGLEMVGGVSGTFGRLYNTLQIDRMLNIVGTGLTIHNAAQLSNNLGVTAIESFDNISEAVGLTFPNADGEQVGIGTVLTSGFEVLVKKTVGEANYTELGAAWAKANRIYQASANLLDTTSELFDSARSLNETTAEHTGQIGNALLQAGVVAENSYDRMVERITPLSRRQIQFEKFSLGIETLEEGLSSISNVASETKDLADTYGSLKESWNEWKEETKTAKDAKIAEAATDKTDSTTTAEPTELDFNKDESDLVSDESEGGQ